MEEITVYDNLITREENEKYRTSLLYNCDFRYGEKDDEYQEPTGVVCDFTNTMNSDDMVDPYLSSMLKNLLNKIYENNIFLKKRRLYRVYLNLFTCNEQPNFHIDGDNTITCLYYLNPSLDLNEGGETQFLIDNEIRGIISKPGRLTVFNGGLLHRATSFKSHPRLTLAFKFI